jgi:hypothetical protein
MMPPVTFKMNLSHTTLQDLPLLFDPHHLAKTWLAGIHYSVTTSLWPDTENVFKN